MKLKVIHSGNFDINKLVTESELIKQGDVLLDNIEAYTAFGDNLFYNEKDKKYYTIKAVPVLVRASKWYIDEVIEGIADGDYE